MRKGILAAGALLLAGAFAQAAEAQQAPQRTERLRGAGQALSAANLLMLQHREICRAIECSAAQSEALLMIGETQKQLRFELVEELTDRVAGLGREAGRAAIEQAETQWETQTMAQVREVLTPDQMEMLDVYVRENATREPSPPPSS
ncbi:MAG: hypothetical protein J4G03_03680 [Gemmatimonadetes bacterium]|nr:hypothetical protein [Gemmatimonadota bacterium]